MKFPSVKTLTDSFKITLQRFPFEMLFALAGTMAAVAGTQWRFDNIAAEGWCTRIILIGNLGLLLNLAVTLYAERKAIPSIKTNAVKVVASLFAVVLLFLLDPQQREADYFRFALFSLGFHLLVSFAAFTDKDHIQGFWQFNKTLFLRFLTGVLYSGVLYLGLAAALAATNFLFNLKIEWRVYTILWYLIVGLFNTLFFLAGVPKNTADLDSDTSYPKGLKIFTQYVLIPLATVYVMILLAYEAKLIIQWSLPKGLVSSLILGYAVFGILSILLIYPIRDQEDNKWIKTYARSFYFLLIPLLALLFLAMGKRVFSYGITEQRYFLLILACWLLFITGYFLLSKKQNIKIIPISLCLLTLLSIYGPQSAFSISTYSQRGILIDIFKRNDAFKDGKLVPLTKKINSNDGSNAMAKLTYLVNNKGLGSLQSYIDVDLDSVSRILTATSHDKSTYYSYRNLRREGELKWIRDYLGLKFIPGRVSVDDVYPDNYQFKSAQNKLLQVNGYDYVLQQMDEYASIDTAVINNIKFTQTGEKRADIHGLSIGNEKVEFDIKALADSLVKPDNKIGKYKKVGNDYILTQNELSITKQTTRYIITLMISDLQFQKLEDESPTILNFEGCYLIKKK